MEIIEAIELALPVFHEHKDSTWKTLGEALKAAGIPANVADRLLEFMPLAFARAFLDGLGIEFRENYIRLDSKTRKKVSKRLADEPVFTESFAFASSLIAEKQASDEFTAVVFRSSEFDAINKAMNAGSRPEELVSSPPILLWDEEADEQEKRESSKPKWQFWK